MRNPWTAKMEQFTPFAEEDRRLLDDLVSHERRRYGAREDIVREGEPSPNVHLVLEGLACRYKLLPDGGRQILAFLVPGDLCDAEIFILSRMDHAIGTLAPSTVALIPGGRMRELLVERPGVAVALWWGTLTDEAVLRERLVDLGRRDAHERIAHVLYELFLRLRAVGAIDDDGFELPLTQADLADATGLTPVHVNRTLQRLREEGLVATEGRRWTVPDPARLREVAGFNPDYLHLDRARDDPASPPGRRLEGLI